MSTLAQIVERVKVRLGGASTTASAVLQNSITASDLTVQLDTTQGFSRGVAQIGFELVRVADIDQAARTLKIPEYGRGYQGTTAQAHTAGAEVLFNPTWRSAVVAEEINGVLSQVYPSIYGVETFETTFPADRRRPVEIPAEAIGVISVFIGDPSLPGVWIEETRWGFNPDGVGGGDRHLWVGGNWRPAWPLRVVYATRPGLFDLSDPASLGSQFEAVTGLDPRFEDLLALGVAARLAPFLEVARLPHAGAEARADAQVKPPGHATSTARYLQQQFEARLEQEQRALHKEHPIRVHRTR